VLLATRGDSEAFCVAHQPDSDRQRRRTDRQTLRLLALGLVAAAVGAALGSGAVQSVVPADGVTLYRGLMLVGLLSLAYLQFRN
jgi:FtsH-binding integral membrane protein